MMAAHHGTELMHVVLVQRSRPRKDLERVCDREGIGEPALDGDQPLIAVHRDGVTAEEAFNGLWYEQTGFLKAT